MNDDDLFKQFGKVHWMFHRCNMKNHNEFGPMADPYRGQGRILSLLKMQPEMNQKDLAYILGIRPQSLGEQLAKLEKGGYIEREQSETDRRAMIIRLTEAGRKMAEQEETQSDFFSCLNEDEKEELSGYLQRLIDSMGKELGEDCTSPMDMWMNMDEEELRKHMKEKFQRFREGFDQGMEGFRGPGFR